MIHTSDVIYALDIGVYNVGCDGRMLASTSAAWCRVDEGTLRFAGLRHNGTLDCGELRIGESASWRCGRNVEQLAETIADDLRSGTRVALGFEAPMWFPIERANQPNLKLFTPRFDKEQRHDDERQGHEWYLQSGAAATVKAISLGVLLFTELLGRNSDLACTTDRKQWQGKTLMLFEAFVTGKYKITPPASLEGAANEWDAFVAALAWGAKHAGLITPRHVEPVVLHCACSHQGESLSVWKTICNATNLAGLPTGPSDCGVVALRTVQAGT